MTRSFASPRLIAISFITALALAGGVMVWTSPVPSAVATPQDAQQAPDPSEIEIVGVPWTGEMGITESVEQIMARQAENDAMEQFTGEIIDMEERELDYPDRSLLPQDPNSPAVSQWPPPPDAEAIDLDREADPREPGGGHDQPPHLPQTTGTSFLGIQISDTIGYVPPDSQGAVGPTQVVVIANGRVKTFNKSTGAADGALNATTNSFFTSVRNGSSTSDPRVRYDRTTNRWFISIINVSTPNRVLLAVSSGSTIASSASFTFFFFQHDLVGATPNTDTGGFADYDTLAVDANAVYLGANIFNAAGTAFLGTTGYVVRKSSVTSGGPIVVTAFRQLATSGGAGPFSPSGVDNWDPAATEGYFVGVNNSTFGSLRIRRVSTPGGTPSISGNISVTVPTTGSPMDVAVLGGGTLDAIDDRHFNAMMHRDRITSVVSMWMAHHFEVNSSGVFSGSGNRDGSRWYQIGSMTGTPTLLQSGTMFDSAASNPKSYWMDSVSMSGQGHMAIGASYGGAADRAGCAVAGRLRTDAAGSTQAATLAVVSGSNYFTGGQRWGDYSQTCVDPNDDQTMWTFQEYCNANSSWGVRAIQLKAPPPATPASCSPTNVSQGASNVNVIVTCTSSGGSELYDTDATYTQRLAASVGGSGVTVNSVTFNSVTQFTMNVSVSAGAATGARTVTATNPDLQAATSGAGILTIDSGACTAPSVTGHPSSQSVCSGGSVTFAVTATGTAPLAYQWRKGGVNIGGATNSSYTINPVATGDAGPYDCVVTNACGSATSNIATLTVNTAPSISSHPASLTRCVGTSATFSVTASGTAPLSYQWRKGGVNIGGATSSSYTIASVVSGDAGNYDCVVTNSCGSAGSNFATLTVNTAPSISSHPASLTRCVGTGATFSVTASGTAPLSYQWRKGGVNIGGATSSSYTIASVVSGDAGNYDCVVTNSCGSATSNVAVLTVNTAPSITSHPSNVTVCSGGLASFSVTASGTAPLSYQWRKNGTNIGGATSSSYTINPVAAGDAGNYDVVVTNSCGSATSNAATLTVNTAPSISSHPSNVTVCSGGLASFSVTASGTAPLSYQWRKNGVNIGGATSSSYAINPVAAGDAGSYDCVVTNTCGSATSNAATLTVNTAPSISSHPSNLTVCEGGSASFSVTAGGTAPLSYQWRKNGVNIGGATSSSYAINPVAAGDAGSYDCVVTNTCGSATSNAATLTVDTSPSITGQPSNQTVGVGGTAVFSVIAAGTAPLSYQWRKNTVNLFDGGSISGSATATLTVSPAALGDAGSYDCVVTNACGSATSNAATLTVNAPACVPCDTNCDGSVNPFDINSFVALLSPTPPAGCSACAGDANGDGSVNPFDINAFLACMGP